MSSKDSKTGTVGSSVAPSSVGNPHKDVYAALFSGPMRTGQPASEQSQLSQSGSTSANKTKASTVHSNREENPALLSQGGLKTSYASCGQYE